MLLPGEAPQPLILLLHPRIPLTRKRCSHLSPIAVLFHARSEHAYLVGRAAARRLTLSVLTKGKGGGGKGRCGSNVDGDAGGIQGLVARGSDHGLPLTDWRCFTAGLELPARAVASCYSFSPCSIDLEAASVNVRFYIPTRRRSGCKKEKRNLHAATSTPSHPAVI